MKNKQKQTYLYAKDAGILQVPYAEYTELMEREDEAQNLQVVKATVLADLQRYMEGSPVSASSAPVAPKTDSEPEDSPALVEESEPENISDEVSEEPPVLEEEPEAKKVSVEFSADTPEPQAPAAARDTASDVPPIKKDIVAHFNKLDESGRLLNVFKQYYTCLNESCGGTVRVTMKDGFCSLWNYDEWEEFAFVDIFENLLRITLDSSHTDALKTLSLCEVPRLISSRRNVVSVQVDDLNNTILDILSQAFAGVGVQIK